MTLHGDLVRSADAHGLVAGAAFSWSNLARKKLEWRIQHGVEYAWSIMRTDRDAFLDIANIFERGFLRLPIAHILALDDADEALTLVHSKAKGKVLLKIL